MIATTNQTLVDGAHNLVVQLTGVSDGAGNEVKVVKVPRRVGIKRVTAEVTRGVVTLLWDRQTPEPFLRLGGRQEFDYTKTGPLSDRGDGTGQVLLSTAGFELGSAYSIKLEMIKK